eukprot:Blabericola_migrator_1__1519@NODE_13_length_24280_cov_225_960393_g10_i0_p1_GENE_NODE_13_length_24280_cov_225_960393_g10_i0NODE_13_length_24280_cov_225_960393_g10_i0_p1_ORF_typecomplete_len2058_score299_13CRM1_repeat_3/PF18787_1/1_1CRM1_repeat_3/PF18787_1/1_5e03_NODE_13_length_24280_cov_225_960393_g10_i0536711540
MSKLPPKEFKEPCQRLAWHEEALKEIGAALSSTEKPEGAFIFPSSIAYVAPLPSLVPAALSKLLGTCISQNDKVVINKPLCLQLHSLIMTKCANYVTKATPDVHLSLPHYMKALTKLIECEALEIKSVVNDFLALKSIQSKHSKTDTRFFDIAVSTFVKECIAAFKSGSVSENVSVDDFFAVLEKLVSTERNLLDCIWLEVRSILNSTEGNEGADDESFKNRLPLFFFQRLLGKSSQADARTGYRLAEVIELLLSKPSCAELYLDSVLDIRHFRLIRDQGGLETVIARLISSLTDNANLKQRLSLISIEMFNLEMGNRIKYQIEYYRDLMMEIAEPRPVITVLSFLRIMDVCLRTTKAEDDFVKILNLLHEAFRMHLSRESISLGLDVKGLLLTMTIAFTKIMLTKSGERVHAVLTAISRDLEEMVGSEQSLTKSDTDLMSSLVSIVGSEQSQWMHWSCSSMMTFEFCRHLCHQPVVLRGQLSVRSGAPFNPLLLLGLSSVMLSSHRACQSILELYLDWVSPGGGTEMPPAIYALVDHCPLLADVARSGNTQALRCIALLARHRNLAPVAFTYITASAAPYTEAHMILTQCRLLIQGGMPYSKFESNVLKSRGAALCFLEEALKIEFLQVSETFETKLWPMFEKGLLTPFEEDVCIVLLQQLTSMGVSPMKETWLKLAQQSERILNLKNRGLRSVFSLVTLLTELVVTALVPCIETGKPTEAGTEEVDEVVASAREINVWLHTALMKFWAHLSHDDSSAWPSISGVSSKKTQTSSPRKKGQITYKKVESSAQLECQARVKSPPSSPKQDQFRDRNPRFFRNCVVIILAPILERFHTYRLNDLAAEASIGATATEFLDPKYPFGRLEQPGGFLAALRDGQIDLHIPKIFRPYVAGLVNCHRLSIGQRVRKTQTVSHPMSSLTTKVLHPRMAPGCSKELVSEAECILYNPPAASSNVPESPAAGMTAQDKFKALLVKAIFQTPSCVPVTLIGNVNASEKPDPWEVKMLLWLQALQHHWRLLFSRYLNSFSMASKNEEAWRVYEFLVSFFEEDTKLSLDTNLSAYLKLIMALSGLGLGHPELGHNIASTLLTLIEKQGLLQIRKDPTNLCWSIGCILVCLSVLHAEFRVSGLLNYSLSLLIKANEALDFGIRRQILTLPGAEISYDVLKVTDFAGLTAIPRQLVIASTLMVIESEVLLRFQTDKANALRLKKIISDYCAVHHPPQSVNLMRSCLDAQLLNAVSEDSVIPEICDTSSLHSKSPCALAMILPRLYQMNYVEDHLLELLIESKFQLLPPKAHGTWAHWFRCLFLNNLRAAGYSSPSFTEMYMTQIQEVLTTPLHERGSDSEMYCALQAACCLLGVQAVTPSLLSFSGDFKNHLKQSVQTFFDLVKLPFQKTREPIGKVAISWLGTARQHVSIAGKSMDASDSRVTLASMTPTSLPFLALWHQTLRCYKDPTLTLDALSNNCLIKHCLQRLKAFEDITSLHELSDLIAQFTSISSLPDLNLRLLIAPILSKVMHRYIAHISSAGSQSPILDNERRVLEDVILNALEFCVAHSPRDSSLASLLSDFAAIYWIKKLSLRLRCHFIRIALQPLCLILSPSEWINLVQRVSHFDNKPKVFSCLLLRQLTGLAVLARHVQERPDNEISLMEKETAMQSLVPQAWHQSFRQRLAALEAGGTKIEGQSEMIYFSTLARRSLEATFDQLLETVIYGSCLMSDPASREMDPMCTGAAAMFINQYLKVNSTIESEKLFDLPVLVQGYAFLNDQLPALHWTHLQQKLISHDEVFSPEAWTTRAKAFADCCVRKGRLFCVNILQDILLSSSMTHEVHTQKILVLAMFIVYAISAPYFLVFQNSLAESEAENAESVLTFEELESRWCSLDSRRWDCLSMSENGVDALVNSFQSRQARDEEERTITVIEASPLLAPTAEALLDSVSNALNPEPLDRAIASAAAGQERESQLRKLTIHLQAETLESRYQKLQLDPNLLTRDSVFDARLVSLPLLDRSMLFFGILVEAGPVVLGSLDTAIKNCYTRYRVLFDEVQRSFDQDSQRTNYIKL